MDSRAKFEEWLNNPIEEDAEAKALVTNDVDEISWLYEIAWQAWKAGRESMREEACNAAYLSWVKDPHVTASDAIKQIEP